MIEGDIVQGEVIALAFGGQGIIKHDGLVIFIPFTAPGDQVTCRITQVKKTHAFAQLLNIHHASPQRIEPLCPYYGVCGGCQLQHLDYESQLAFKKQAIEDALIRIGGGIRAFIPAVVASEKKWTYRRHITLSLKPVNGSFQAGYIGADNHSLISVSHCPIFNRQSDDILIKIQRMASLLQSMPNDQARVAIMKHKEHYLLFFHFNRLPKNCEAVLEQEWQQDNYAGIFASAPNRSVQFGQKEFIFELEGMSFKFSPQAFVQNHPEQSAIIYREICRMALPLAPGNILDLYCGIGITSLLLAKIGFSVIGVEYNKVAVSLTQENALNNGISHVNFRQGDVKKHIKELLTRWDPQLVIMNPPRIGVEKEVISQLLLHAPKKIIYVSCMPPTLARDLRLLCAGGYRLESCQAFDMFPQTTHLETLVVLNK